MRTPRNLEIDSPRSEDLSDIAEYVMSLDRHLRYLIRAIHGDFDSGRGRLEVREEEPCPDELDQGERVLYEHEGVMRMYTQVDGQLYYLEFEEA